LTVFLPDSRIVKEGYWVYEASRGCWWGEKSHCTFCGLNGQGMASRQKSPDRVIEELRLLSRSNPTKKVVMTDNIMPHEYFRTLLPRLKDEQLPSQIFYALKSNLSLRHMRLLREAGIKWTQIGIEALSTGLLKLMAKGVSASQNITALRYARAYDIVARWGFLCDFPNDKLEFYEETLALLPLIRHFTPPVAAAPIVLSRFSPYHSRPADFGISDLQVMGDYIDVLPSGAPVNKVAYFFEGQYRSAVRDNPDIMAALEQAVSVWRNAWSADRCPPELSITPEGSRFVLRDTRGLGAGPDVEYLDREQALMALVRTPCREADAAAYQWALARKVAVELDGSYVPLATAPPALLEELEGGRVLSSEKSMYRDRVVPLVQVI
jgi:ribosomal peptide maturation radical SAM protein 1